MLFKGRFQIDIKTTAQGILEKGDNLKEKLKYVSDDINNADMSKFISHNFYNSSFYKTIEMFDFKYHQPLDINQKTMDVRSKDFNLSFRLLSEQMEILKIIGDKITFSNSKVKNYTTTLSSNIEIISI